MNVTGDLFKAVSSSSGIDARLETYTAAMLAWAAADLAAGGTGRQAPRMLECELDLIIDEPDGDDPDVVVAAVAVIRLGGHPCSALHEPASRLRHRFIITGPERFLAAAGRSDAVLRIWGYTREEFIDGISRVFAPGMERFVFMFKSPWPSDASADLAVASDELMKHVAQFDMIVRLLDLLDPHPGAHAVFAVLFDDTPIWVDADTLYKFAAAAVALSGS